MRDEKFRIRVRKPREVAYMDKNTYMYTHTLEKKIFLFCNLNESEVFTKL